MKKIIILIISIFSLSGCYDYKEITNLSFVSAIGIDYVDNKYIITLEILNDKLDKESKDINTYTVNGSSKTLAKAIENAANKVSNQTNYSHLKIAIISNSVAKEKLKNINDFFLRSTYFRENFYLVLTNDNTPEEILNNKTKENPIPSVAIVELLEANKYSENSSILKTFDNVINEILTYGIDTSISNISIDNNNFIIDGIAIFNGYNLVNVLDNEYGTLYNILTNNFYRPVFSKEYNDSYFSISFATGNFHIKLDKNIYISGEITGKIMDNEAAIDITNLDNLKTLNNDFTKIINEKVTKFIKIIQNNKSDILGITRNYFINTRIKNELLWLNVDINSNIKFNINKKGLIYEVENEK